MINSIRFENSYNLYNICKPKHSNSIICPLIIPTCLYDAISNEFFCSSFHFFFHVARLADLAAIVAKKSFNWLKGLKLLKLFVVFIIYTRNTMSIVTIVPKNVHLYLCSLILRFNVIFAPIISHLTVHLLLGRARRVSA